MKLAPLTIRMLHISNYYHSNDSPRTIRRRMRRQCCWAAAAVRRRRTAAQSTPVPATMAARRARPVRPIIITSMAISRTSRFCRNRTHRTRWVRLSLFFSQHKVHVFFIVFSSCQLDGFSTTTAGTSATNSIECRRLQQ